MPVSVQDRPYTAHSGILPKVRHYAQLKALSIQLLGEYLEKPNVAVDRLRNAHILLDSINALPVTPAAYLILLRMLNESKKNALREDAREDASRFSFFRRHRFGSRYIALLDDLRERVLFCQSQQERNGFRQYELADFDELKTQLAARTEDDHATRYLAEQVQQKEKFLRLAFR